MRISALALLAAFALAGAAACSDNVTTQPQSTSVLVGLSATSSNDTVTSPVPTPSGSGYFRGTVMGPSLTGTGTDTLKTSPKIAGVVVTIYPRLADVNGAIAVGPAAGTTTSDAQGLWKLPTLPAGEYVVAFVPPESGIYHGSYAFGPLRSNSSQYPWWVVLNKK